MAHDSISAPTPVRTALDALDRVGPGSERRCLNVTR
jgi:hypothetical protein